VTSTGYYGRPVIKEPPWKALDIAGYLFAGGLAGTSSVLAAGASMTRRPVTARAAKLGALVAVSLGAVGLVQDLGRPARFVNMLRVFKPTSPMSVGSWLIAAYGPATAAAAFSDVTGLWPPLGAVATAGAALLGPAVASYTGALLADTAVPAWHDGYRELPFVFVASGASASAGLALLAAPLTETAPARRLAVAATARELLAAKSLERHVGLSAETYRNGRAGTLLRASQVLAAAGAFGAVVLRRSRAASMASGAALIAASACARFGTFFAGRQSAADPKYTIVPQRERLAPSR
jgi:DMSO reductase anchor subunit